MLGFRLGTPDHYLREGGEGSIGPGGVGATADIDESGSSNDEATVSSPSNFPSPSDNVVDLGDGIITEHAQNSTGNMDEDVANTTSAGETTAAVGETPTEDAAEYESGAVSEIDVTDSNSSIGASFFDRVR